jgi:hypothetical protein
MEFTEEEEKQISSLLFSEMENICEKFIDHATQIGGFNRFNIKTFLLHAARYGYKTALNNSQSLIFDND